MKFTVDLPSDKTKEIELTPELVAGYEQYLGSIKKDGVRGVLIDLDPKVYGAIKVWVSEARIEEAKKLLSKEKR